MAQQTGIQVYTSEKTKAKTPAKPAPAKMAGNTNTLQPPASAYGTSNNNTSKSLNNSFNTLDNIKPVSQKYAEDNAKKKQMQLDH